MNRLTTLILTLFIIYSQANAQTIRQYLTSANKWTEVTSKADLTDKINSKGYYFAIASANQDYTLGLANGVKQYLSGSPAESTLWYMSDINPLTNLSALFYIETSNNVDGTFCLRNVEKSEYLLQTSNNNPWDMYLNDQATPVTWTNIDFNFIDETAVFNMTWTRFNARSDRFFGAWEDAYDANNLTVATAELAGNKPEAKKGNFVVYAIKRNDYLRQYIGEEKNVSLTPFIINHSFESNGWNGRGRLFGWTVVGSWHFMDNNALTNEMGRDGSYYVQDYNHSAHILESTIEQTIYDLPVGMYRATVLAGGQANQNLYAKSGDRTISDTGEFWDENKTDRSITFEVKEGEADDITIGYYHNEQGAKRWVALDNFRLTYIDNAYVGTATADAYIQPGKVVNVSYPDHRTCYNESLIINDNVSVTCNGQAVEITITDAGFSFIAPAGLEHDTAYDIVIPQGAVGYKTDRETIVVENDAQTITVKTPILYDQETFLQSKENKLLLSRGKDFGTASTVDEVGIRVFIETDANNYTTIKYIDTDWYAYNKDWCWSDGGSAEGRTPMTYHVYGNNTDGYRFTAVKKNDDSDEIYGNLYVVPSAPGRVANNGVAGNNFDADSSCDLWLLMPASTRDHLWDHELPADFTEHIINPSFEDNQNGWQQIEGKTIDMYHQNNNSFGMKNAGWYLEQYNTNGTYGVQQTLGTLPNGYYKVTLKATYNGNDGKAVFFANNKVVEITDGVKELSIILEVTDGILTFGAKGVEVEAGKWLAFDDFRLYYFSNGAVAKAVPDKDVFLPGQTTINFIYNDRFTPVEAEQLVLGTEKPVINGIKLTPVVTESGFSITIPEDAGFVANTKYTISIPEGVVGYASAPVYNHTQDIEVRTIAITDGTYYLATESFGGEKLLLSRGNRWGTEAVLDKYGLAVEVRTNGNNETTFHFLDNNQYLFRGNDNAVFTDNSNNNTWVVSPTETDGDFTISVPNGNNLHAVNEYFSNRLNTGNLGSMLVWNFISRDERDNIIAAYPTANKQNVAEKAGEADLDVFIGTRTAIDCSDKILNRTSGAQGAWMWHDVYRNPDHFTWNESNTCFEWYHGAGYATQHIEGLKSGVYKLTVDAFDRMFSVNKEVELRTAGYTENITFVKANGEQVRVKPWYDVHVECGTTDPGFPYCRDQSRQTMDNGFATNELYVYVDEDGILDIEVNKPSWIYQNGAPEGSNFVFNNFRLTYYGRELTLADNAAMEYDVEPEYDIVHLKRTLKAGYNTFAVPFDIDAETIAEKFGEGTKVYVMDHASDENVGFMTVDDICANTPYIIYIQDNVENPTFNNLTLIVAHTEMVEAGNWKMLSNFTPNFSYATLRAEEGVEPYVLVNKAEGTRIMKAGANAKTNGMRAYFIYAGTADTQNLAPRCIFGWEDDNTTGIDSIETAGSETAKTGKTTYYSTSGLKVNSPKQGVYIVKSGGKIQKVMVE